MKPHCARRSEVAARRPRVRRALPALALLGLVVGCGAFLGSAQAGPPAAEAPAAPAGAVADSAGAVADTTAPHRVLAYYFHTTQRCASCRKIEAYTTEAIQTGFAPELKDGRLVFQAVNVDDKGNEHFVKDYKLYTKSVILVDERSGAQIGWKNLPKVWELLGDKEKFVRYIQGETRGCLSGQRS